LAAGTTRSAAASHGVGPWQAPTPTWPALAGELLLKISEFARLWERYEVKANSRGKKTFHHPDVGDLTLGYRSMLLEGSSGHRLGHLLRRTRHALTRAAK
jgi:hypothetical protein